MKYKEKLSEEKPREKTNKKLDNNLKTYSNINEAIYDYAISIKNNFISNINIKTNENMASINYSEQPQTIIYTKAKEMFSKIDRNTFKNGIEDIYVSNGDIKESIAKTVRNIKQKKYITEQLEIFKNLDQIIENGKLIAKADENKGRYKYSNWKYYATPIIINNKKYIVEFDTTLRNDGQRHFRLIRLYSIKEVIKKTSYSDRGF